MPGYKRACRFCGQLVEANSAYCPFCRRAHPHQMVCPWCMAPIQADWQACNKCGKALAIPCAKCGNPVGPDADACATC
ncbi:MAG TPA: zinc ribbon domain-containing protein, partial [Thermoplasmata archaeon]|nr:zinc ribbon domain-containing protein [Thermoplasmata archaeon]